MDFWSGLGVKETLDSVPQQPESRTSIDDEHTVQGLCEKKSKLSLNSEDGILVYFWFPNGELQNQLSLVEVTFGCNTDLWESLKNWF